MVYDFYLLQEDNAKQRALNDMMGGVLEVKKEDILRMVRFNYQSIMTKENLHWLWDYNIDEQVRFTVPLYTILLDHMP